MQYVPLLIAFGIIFLFKFILFNFTPLHLYLHIIILSVILDKDVLRYFIMFMFHYYCYFTICVFYTLVYTIVLFLVLSLHIDLSMYWNKEAKTHFIPEGYIVLRMSVNTSVAAHHRSHLYTSA